MRGHDYHRKGMRRVQVWLIHLKQQYSNLQAVFNVDKEEGLTLIEIAEDVTIEDVLTSTGCDFQVAPDVKKIEQIAS